MSTKEIVEQASLLPIEERAALVDSLIKTLNPPNEKIDRKWTLVARRRLAEIRSGKVKPIPGNRVFDKIRERFTK